MGAAAFDTRFRKAAWLTGVAARKIAKAVQQAGATLLMPAGSFFVGATKGPLEEGETDRVISWAEALLQQIRQETRSAVLFTTTDYRSL